MTGLEHYDPKELVKHVVSEYIKARPERITLSWDDKKSSIRLLGDGLDWSSRL